MSAASIVIEQDGGRGAAGTSRDDLVLGEVITLHNGDDTGVRTWRWRLVDRPEGSSATLTGPTAPAASFTPDVPGSYMVELAVDGGQSGQVDRRIAAVREDLFGVSVRVPAAGEEDEANWGGNTRGWTPDMELWLRTLAENGGGGEIDLSDLPDATALSVLGRASNSAGDYADIVAGTDGHTLRRSGTALGFGTLAAGAFATGPGIVTPAMLDNGAARSILGRAENSSGARADIAGAGDRTILSDDASTLAFRTLSQLGIPHTVASSAVEVDTGAGGSSSEIDFVNVTIPANTLDSDGRRLVIEQVGDLLNTGSAREFQWRLYLDGVVVLSDNVTYNASTSSRRAFVLTTVIYSAGQTDQRSQLRMWMANLNPSAPNTGLHGQIDGAAFMGGPVRGNNSAADRTAAMTLRITIQLSAATSAHRVRQQGFTVKVE